MKVNIILNPNEQLKGYENVLVQDLTKLINASCDEIRANVLFEVNPQTIPLIISKMSLGGLLYVSMVNIEKLTNDFSQNMIDINVLNNHTRNAFFDAKSVDQLCEQFGLSKEEQTHTGYIKNLVLRRTK